MPFASLYHFTFQREIIEDAHNTLPLAGDPPFNVSSSLVGHTQAHLHTHTQKQESGWDDEHEISLWHSVSPCKVNICLDDCSGANYGRMSTWLPSEADGLKRPHTDVSIIFLQ